MSIRRQLGDLAKSLDSSAVGSFLSKGASEADFTTISYSDVSGTPSAVADSAVATAIIDSAYVQSRVTTVAVGLDSATTINLLDSNYMAARSGGGAGFYVYNYDASAGQTTFQDSDAAGNVMSYSADGIIVFYNGVMLPTADYTATDGTSVVLGTGADSQDVVTIAKWSVGGGASGGAAWYGDRGLMFGGYGFGGTNTISTIQYWDITTTGNASTFGNLTATTRSGASVSDATYGVHNASTGHDYAANTNHFEYVTISTTSNASDFGDFGTNLKTRVEGSTPGDGTYGYFAGGYNTDLSQTTNIIQYITIATPGNSADYGDLTLARTSFSGCNNSTIALFAGGSSYTNTIDYITMGTPSNATDFGDLSASKSWVGSLSDDTYGVFGGGDTSSFQNVIEYVTIATPSNTTDFGDLTVALSGCMGTSNNTRGTFAGGNSDNGSLVSENIIQYVTIATPSNATDFGDLVTGVYAADAISGSPS